MTKPLSFAAAARRAWLARMTPLERAERRSAQDTYNQARRCNEDAARMWKHYGGPLLARKVEALLREDVRTAIADPTRVTLYDFEVAVLDAALRLQADPAAQRNMVERAIAALSADLGPSLWQFFCSRPLPPKPLDGPPLPAGAGDKPPPTSRQIRNAEAKAAKRAALWEQWKATQAGTGDRSAIWEQLEKLGKKELAELWRDWNASPDAVRSVTP